MKKKATCPAMIALPVRKPVVPPSTPAQVDEVTLLADLRGLIQSARLRVATVANTTTTMLCWHVGCRLLKDNLQDGRAAYGKTNSRDSVTRIDGGVWSGIYTSLTLPRHSVLPAVS